MAVRVKVMSKMNIAETRAPQDGRISLMLTGRAVDFRVSSQATTHGENIVLRILDRQKGIVPLDGLGLEAAQLQLLKKMIARPEGIILLTGPTGSGKTTTLYSVLNHINNDGLNIMTLEDPVEYPMTLIRQTSVNEAAKMDFGNGIRSLMRQDPDVILVGEIRDEDTATMAFRAAMTGHQVYSTLHTNSAAGAIPRLLDIGIVPDVLAGNIIGIVAQRLVRRLCKHCKQAHQASAGECSMVGARADRPPTLYRAVGCDQCEYQGYRGRMAIIEILKMDGELDELIAHRATGRELQKSALTRGFRTLADDGVRRVLDGSTALDELMRVVDLTDRMYARPAQGAGDGIIHGTLCLQGHRYPGKDDARPDRSDQSGRPRAAIEAHGPRPGTGRPDPSRREPSSLGRNQARRAYQLLLPHGAAHRRRSAARRIADRPARQHRKCPISRSDVGSHREYPGRPAAVAEPRSVSADFQPRLYEPGPGR